MFIFYTAKIRKIIDTTKYFELNNVNRIDLFSIAVSSCTNSSGSCSLVLISLRLNPDDDPDHQGLDQDKVHHQLCRFSAHFTVYNLTEIKLLYPPSASRARHSKFCLYKMKRPTILKEDRSFLNKITERILFAFVFFQSCIDKVNIINAVIKHHPSIST